MNVQVTLVTTGALVLIYLRALVVSVQLDTLDFNVNWNEVNVKKTRAQKEQCVKTYPVVVQLTVYVDQDTKVQDVISHLILALQTKLFVKTVGDVLVFYKVDLNVNVHQDGLVDIVKRILTIVLKTHVFLVAIVLILSMITNVLVHLVLQARGVKKRLTYALTVRVRMEFVWIVYFIMNVSVIQVGADLHVKPISTIVHPKSV
jgi:hypothetical protein